MALRHSDRHLDPHGHRHGPRRDELHGRRLASRNTELFLRKWDFKLVNCSPAKMGILEGESCMTARALTNQIKKTPSNPRGLRP